MIFSSCPLLGLGAGREERLREHVAVLQAFRHRLAGYGASPAVVAPSGACDEAAHDALDVDAVGALDDHGAAGEFVGDAEVVAVGGETYEVVRDDVLGHVEPELGNLGKDCALLRDSGGQDDVECGDAVGGDHKKQAVAEVVGVADFALVQAVGQGGFSNCGHFLLLTGWIGLKLRDVSLTLALSLRERGHS